VTSDASTARAGIAAVDRRRLTLAVLIGFLAVFAIGNYVLPLGRLPTHWWSDVFWTVASLAAALKCFAASRAASPPLRRSWQLFALACFSWFVGMLIWDYQELVLHQFTPFPAWPDAFYFLFAVFMALGVFFYRDGTPGLSVTLLEASQLGIFVSCIVIAHLAVFAQPLRMVAEPTLYVAVALSYPIVFMSLLVYAVAALGLRVRGTARRPLAYVVAGIAAHAIGDFFYAYELLGGTYQAGHHLDIVWLIGFALIFWGAGIQSPGAAPDQRNREFDLQRLHTGRMLPVAALTLATLAVFAFRHTLQVDDYHRLLYPVLCLVAFSALRERASSTLEARYSSELLASESRLRQLFFATPALTSITRLSDGTFLDVNNGYLDATGYRREEMIGHTSTELGLWADPDDRVRVLARLRDRQPVRGIDIRIRTRSGAIREVLASFEPMRIGDEECLLGIALDVTERKIAEAEMRKLSGALEQAADTVMITDPQGLIEYVNPAFEEITGFSRAEVLGKNPRLLNGGLQGPEFYQALWDTLERGQVFSEVFINRRKNGDLFYEQKTITPLRDASGAVTHFVATGRDITDRIEVEERLRFLAHHDTLTELPNRALLLERLQRDLAAAGSAKRKLGVLFLDLDRFKIINDTLGHDTGDAMLRQLSERLLHRLRPNDSIARFGGDEFVLLINDIKSVDELASLAERMLIALLPPFDIHTTALHVTASVGISVYPDDGEDSGTLLKHADAAMYRAKEMGGNTFQFYSAEMGSHAMKRLTLENDLRMALDRGEFVLHYQPQIDIESGRVVGVEALLRWNHAERGLVGPLDFIPLLEETGLIVAVGRWVLESALAQLAEWHRAGWPSLSVAVNLSSHQFHEPELAERLADYLRTYALPARCVELEITESTLLQHIPATTATLEKLSQHGLGIALDDFGTGYSSLSYLRRFPIDTLKIDRSFVRDIPADSNAAAITRAIVVMAQSLQLRLVAEGVELEQQRDFLRSLGCSTMQGYLFSKPLDAAAMTRYLQTTLAPTDGTAPPASH
jgi:diguanylate cyclase (GGDEF)-like protein/PAS domain S-box-containing protein